MHIAALIGSPVAHSLSPALHNAAFATAGLDWMYVAFDVPAGSGQAAVEAMRALGLGGLSVTTPLKEEVAAAVDALAPAATALRSVNTVVRSPSGDLVGHSTDGDGFVASLRDHAVELDGAKVTVVGAGAAGRSLVDAIGRAGAADVAIVNRRADRAEDAAGLAAVARVGGPDDIARADVVVNATTVGMGTDEVPFDVAALRSGQVVADLVYQPIETALLRAAGAARCRVIDGLEMLVHQAALQQQLWTGRRPDPAALRDAALAELARRRDEQ